MDNRQNGLYSGCYMNSAKENIAIIHEHYHVTEAGIRLVLDALSLGGVKYYGHASQYLWYSPQKFQDRSSPSERFSQEHATLIEDKKLGYITASFASVEQFEAAIDKRKHEKLEIIKPKLRDHDAVVHVIQNPTLLKNPVETQANARIASQLLDQNYLQIWHLHDFLEESSARQDLRKFIKTFAGDKTEERYGRNGCGLAWTTSPNIFYATINLKDRCAIRGFFPEKLGKTVFYLPDPVDIDLIRVPPLFKRQSVTIDDRINDYCESNADTGYVYNAGAALLLATEFARERKNTGEQILLLKLLNSLKGRQEDKFQLLITLIPTMGADAERIGIFQEYIRLNQLPVVMGFGRQIIARGNEVKAGQFTMTDLWNHPRAHVGISTSVKEGFGLNFINPAIATFDNPFTLPTVGRRLKDIFPDFETLGMTLHDSAFYDAIIMDQSILLDDARVFDKQRKNIVKGQLAHRYETVAYQGVIPLGKDFSCYPADEQILLMDIIDYAKLSDTMSDFIEFILDRDKMDHIAKRNAAAMMQNLSLPSYIDRVKEMIKKAFIYKQARLAEGEIPAMILDNSPLFDYYAKN
jgi:hypothetical protein